MHTTTTPCHIEAISNGLGAPSMWLIEMAGEGLIPATISISADTGWENDRVLSDGSRVTNQQYFDQVVQPRCAMYGLTALFVRATDQHGAPMPGLGEWVEQHVTTGQLNSIKIPLFGSNGGRLHQPCTDRMKVRAIRQALRAAGATTARTAQALTINEVHRMKGERGHDDGGYYTMTSLTAQWHHHYYPLIDKRIDRTQVRQWLTDRGVPYLLSSECDGCPHQDWPRWSRHTPEVIDHLAAIEQQCHGQFFFTAKRIPLKDALAVMQDEWEATHQGPLLWTLDDPDFGCDSGAVCGV